MHELGCAEGIFEIVRRYVPLPQAPAVREVRVRVGDGAGVLADSLAFCFEAIVAGTPWASARLLIEPAAGRDLQIVDLELDDTVVPS
jgi:hydrogenase nickel incorporation protein HypA/HybF